MLPDPSSPLRGIPGPVDLEPRRAGDNNPIYYTTCEKNAGADYQRHVEAAYCDSLSSNKGSKRNSQKKGAVVPGKYGASSGGKVVGKTGLLRGKE
jgi:hypothetical protein